MCRAIRDVVWSSRDAAVWISEGMGGIARCLRCARNPDLKGFDHIIIGGSIRSGATRKELQDYIIKNRGMLKDKISALFAVCGNREKPVGPEQKTTLIDNHLGQIVRGLEICHQRFLMAESQNRWMDPESRKRMEESYPKICGQATGRL